MAKEKLEVDVDGKHGIVGSYCSWDSLEMILKRIGHIKRYESLSRVKVDEKGLTYYVSNASD